MSVKASSIAQSSLIIFALALISSCGGTDSSSDTKSNANSQNITADQTKYIKIEDAKDFLPSWSKENVLVYHDIGEPDDMHPTNGISGARMEVMGYTQIFLIGIDFQKLTAMPIAVKALPAVSADGKEYTYELRNDIKFDDGSPLTVEDVIFTFKANKCQLTNNPFAKPYLDNLLDIVVDKTNPNVFKTIMKEKYIQNVNLLSDYPLMQRSFFDKKNVLSNYTFAQLSDKNFKADQQKDLSEWATEFNDAKYSRDPNYLVGAGPYKFEKWDAGQTITLVRKKNHWSEKAGITYANAYPEKIIFKINKDANSQMLEFKAQTLDASTYVTSKTLLELQKDDNFNINYNSRFTDTYNYWYVAMNMKPDGVKHKKLFTDKKVRRAMAMLAPLEDINKVINKGKCKRIVGPVSPLKPDYNTDLKLVPFDIEGAKKLLDEAGWKDSDGDNIRDKMIDGEKVQLEFNMNYMTTSVDFKDLAQMISEQMYKAGVKANINPLDFAVLYDNAKNHDYDMMIAVLGGTFAPEDYTQTWHTSSWTSKGSNYTGFGDATSDALVDSIKYTIDDQARYKLVKKLQTIIYDEQPEIFLFASLRRDIIHKRFGNQEMYFERPGIWLSNLKLLSNSGISAKNMAN